MTVDMSQHFTTGKLLKFVAPSIAMTIFASLYSIVDGLFVSNFAGKTAFTAVNLIFPFIMILSASGMMIGTGGSAIVAKTRGEGDDDRANRYFSMLVWFALGLGIVLEGFVVVTAEVDQVMFGRTIHWDSFVVAFVLTMVFTAIVMLVMRPKLAKIDMVESLKSNE